MKNIKFLIILALLSSCIPAYLPKYNKISSKEKFLNDDAERFIKKDCIVIIENAKNLENKALGHQYLFGIIPFTSIYLSQSADDLAHDVVSDISQSFGYETISAGYPSVYTINKKNIKYYLEAKIENLSLSGFDAFFFRNLRVSGNINFKFYKSKEDLQHNNVYFQNKQPLEKSTYKLTAHLSELNLLLEKALRDATIKAFSEVR